MTMKPDISQLSGTGEEPVMNEAYPAAALQV